MVGTSMTKLPIEDVPIYKICDVLTEIGILASNNRQEVIVIQCRNRIIAIIVDIIIQKFNVNINLCMASLLELIANIWIYFDAMTEWMYKKLQKMQNENELNYQNNIKSNNDILVAKSVISTSIFNDFIDGLDEFEAEE